MTVSVNLHKPATASVIEHDAGDYSNPFSAVRVSDKDGNSVTLFLPGGTGAAVAAAITAAIGAV